MGTPGSSAISVGISFEFKTNVGIGEIGGRQASVIISQIRLIDTRRLINKIGFVDTDTFEKIRKAVKKLI